MIPASHRRLALCAVRRNLEFAAPQIARARIDPPQASPYTPRPLAAELALIAGGNRQTMQPDSAPPPPLPASWPSRWFGAAMDYLTAALSSPALVQWGPWWLLAAALPLMAGVVAGTAQLLQVPFAIECMEGGMAQMVERAAAGLPLYTEPTLDYIAFPYGPLGYQLAGAVTHLGLNPMVALRMVNAFSNLAALGLTFALARTWGLTAGWALLAASWALLAQELSGTFFAVARADGPLQFCMVAAFLLMARGRSWPSGLMAGGLMGLSLFFKQSGLPYGALLGAVWLLMDWRRGLAIWAGLGLGVAALLGPSVLSGDPWQQLFLYKLAGDYPFYPGAILTLGRLVIGKQALMFALAMAAVVLVWRKGQFSRAHQMLALLVTTLVPSTLLLMKGAFVNSLLSVPVAVGICGAMGLSELQPERSAAPHLRLRWGLLLLAMLAQLGALIHNPFKAVPAPAEVKAWHLYREWLNAAPGQVLVTDDRWVTVGTSQPRLAADVAVPVLNLGPRAGGPAGAKVSQALLAKIASDRPLAVVTFTWPRQLEANTDYTYIGPLNALTAMGPKIGNAGYVWQVYLRRDVATAAGSATAASSEPVLDRLQRGALVGWPVRAPAALQR